MPPHPPIEAGPYQPAYSPALFQSYRRKRLQFGHQDRTDILRLYADGPDTHGGNGIPLSIGHNVRPLRQFFLDGQAQRIRTRGYR